MTSNGKEIKWSVQEFEYFEKGISWYWLTIIVGVVLIFLALLQKNFLFAIFVVIAELLVLNWGSYYPKAIEIKLNNKGLEINRKKFYPYDGLKGFAVNPTYSPSLFEVFFFVKQKLTQEVKVLARSEDIEDIQEFLRNYLPETEHDESLIDHIARILKF